MNPPFKKRIAYLEKHVKMFFGGNEEGDIER